MVGDCQVKGGAASVTGIWQQHSVVDGTVLYSADDGHASFTPSGALLEDARGGFRVGTVNGALMFFGARDALGRQVLSPPVPAREGGLGARLGMSVVRK